MPAYYNENNPEKAEWLRVLISRNLIAPGDVDERSITDVQPDDVKHYTQCHWFAGIGLWSLACRQAAAFLGALLEEGA
jgi:DNA (cytosine-5)-methyltransferase 1